MGAANARIQGWSEAADALARAGVLQARTVGVVKAMLSLMAHAPEPGAPAGSTGAIEIPLTVQDSMLSVGRIPLTRLPPVTWPAE